ncbi:hypothetical protein C2S52_011295 [Perilla frutescens var. hirtella]|nr:hypothetical protein C2S52_011295 [Perilla frutescens var. hirtella]
MDRFLAGLRREIREKVAMYHFDKLKDMVQYAIEIEKWLESLEMRQNEVVQVESNIELSPRAHRQTTPFRWSEPESFEEFLRTYVPPTRPASPVQLVMDVPSQASNIQEEIHVELPSEIVANKEDSTFEVTISVDAPIEEIEINVAVEKVQVNEKLEELKSCSKKEIDISGAMVEDHKEFEPASLEKLPSSNIICPPFSCDVFILHVVKDVPLGIDVPPDLFVVPISKHPMKLRLRPFDTKWKILKLCLMQLVQKKFDGRFVFVFDLGGSNSRTNSFQEEGNDENVPSKE